MYVGGSLPRRRGRNEPPRSLAPSEERKMANKTLATAHYVRIAWEAVKAIEREENREVKSEMTISLYGDLLLDIARGRLAPDTARLLAHVVLAADYHWVDREGDILND